jgi:protein-S-isoprenylcysteine O-methyltransferase Ste14
MIVRDVAPTLVATWPYALYFWAIFVGTFLPEWRLYFKTRRTARPGPQDAGSVRIIMIGNTLGSWCAFALAWLWPGAAIVTHQRAAFWMGLTLLVCGAALRRHCFRMLGASFTGAVIVRPDQAVVRRGAYRWVRHPSYSAAFLIMGGIGLALTNWLSLLVMIAMSVVVYGYRVRVEERALVQTLGEPYRDYMRRTKRFVPFVL